MTARFGRRRRPASGGDREAVTELIGRPAPWPEPYDADQAYPHGHFTGVGTATTWHPAPVREEWPLRGTTVPMASLPGRPSLPPPPPPPLTVVSVTVGDGHGATSRGAAHVHAALTYIRLKTAILEGAGHGSRIDDAEHARRRGDPLAPRSAVGEICREAASLLRGIAGAR